MALTNADFRRMVAKGRTGAARPLTTPTLPDRMPRRVEPVARMSARHAPHEGGTRGELARDVRTIEIVWAPAPAPARGRLLGGLAALAKVLALPALFVGGLYAQPTYECQRQKSLGMLYYGTTVQMCVNERMAERAGNVQAFLERQMRGM